MPYKHPAHETTLQELQLTTPTAAIQLNNNNNNNSKSKQRHHAGKELQHVTGSGEATKMAPKHRKRHKSIKASKDGGGGEYPSSLPILVDGGVIMPSAVQNVNKSINNNASSISLDHQAVQEAVNSIEMAKVFTTARPTIIIYPTGIELCLCFCLCKRLFTFFPQSLHKR